jgi:hypothetical protein
MKPGKLTVVVIVLLWFALYLIALRAFEKDLERGDWVYRSRDGIPAPCPDGKGFWPRDCHDSGSDDLKTNRAVTPTTPHPESPRP